MHGQNPGLAQAQAQAQGLGLGQGGGVVVVVAIGQPRAVVAVMQGSPCPHRRISVCTSVTWWGRCL